MIEIEVPVEQVQEQIQEAAHHAKDRWTMGVTLFQVAISVAAISVLVRRRRFWWVSMGFGLVGFVFFIQGLMGIGH